MENKLLSLPGRIYFSAALLSPTESCPEGLGNVQSQFSGESSLRSRFENPGDMLRGLPILTWRVDKSLNAGPS